MSKFNDANVVLMYFDCQQACSRKGLTCRVTRSGFVARNASNVICVDAHDIIEFRRRIRSYRRPAPEMKALRIDKHMRMYGVQMPRTLADNEDNEGRIPGDVGYKGPGK